MLSAFGINQLEERVYRHLIGVTSASVPELAEALFTSGSLIRRALGMLEARAMVSRMAAKPPRYIAAPPDVVADTLTLRGQLEISEARAELGSLVDAYRRGRDSRGTDEVIEIITGAEQAALRIIQLQQNATDEILEFVKPPFIAIDVDTAASIPSRARPKPTRTIWDSSVMEISGFVAEMRLSPGAPGDQVRLHSALPTKLLIFDRELAILPLAHNVANATPAVIVVHRSGLLDTALALFEHYWESSLPLQVDEEPQESGLPSGDHQRILALMLAGASDDAIARQLGVSLRTVERRVRELMDKAGVKTRVQLGWHAHARGWVRSDAPAAGAPAASAGVSPGGQLS